MTQADSIESASGPDSYDNFRCQLLGVESVGAAETELFSDAYFTGEIKIGPYYLINAVAIQHRSGYFRPAIILRFERYASQEEVSRNWYSDTSTYHGGNIADEIAALVALCLGVRVQAGPIIREFVPNGDPRGRPTGYESGPWPSSSPFEVTPILPWAVGQHELSEENLGLINELHRLSSSDAATLIKAARTYQRATWIADSDPQISWLLLVSAVEAVTSKLEPLADPTEQFTKCHPDLAERLQTTGGREFLEDVARLVHPEERLARRFRQFIINFRPDAPSARPSSGQLMWTPKSIARALAKVYDHRSRALHDGTPFPLPICRAPDRLSKDAAPCEAPFMIAIRAQGGTWYHGDLPMYLHIFEYLVRGAMLNWWKSRIV
ncbi:MAG: hypothetical protein M3T49_06285 [Candidatus Eremiobacteraeota bacterium]|nr:hypothetical protein [Candidatus Eremiobacteraeota bacterium]